MSQAAVVTAVSVSARSARANALAERLERGAEALAILAASLTDAEWKTPIPHDGRAIGVVVHHVGTMYPLEIELAQVLASGQPVVGVTWANVHEINAAHAREHAHVTKSEALLLLQKNSTLAAAAIRALGDERAGPGRACLALWQRADHVPVHARGPRRTAQLPSPREDSRDARAGRIAIAGC